MKVSLILFFWSIVHLFNLTQAHLQAQHPLYPNVQWASEIVGFSSEYYDEKYPAQCTAKQALGIPNKLPAIGSSPCAWSPAHKTSRKDEWIHVSFDKAQKIRQVAIGESHNAGTIYKIFLYEESGTEHLVYKNLDTHPIQEGGRMFHCILNELTPYAVKSVKIVLNTLDVPGWNHIDAIGITESSDPIQAKINVSSDVPAEIDRLTTFINSEYDEILPIISPDGKVLYFDRKNHPNNMESDTPGKHNDDIWYSTFDGKFWKNPIKMPAPLNNGGHNYVCSVTPDGNKLLLGNKYLPNGDIMGGVSISQKVEGGWSFPKPLMIDDYYNRNAYSEYFLTPNGKHLLLAIERDDSFGGRDLYVSHLKEDGSWTRPKNLGPTLNSAGTELTPFLASDGKSLYFASNGHSGFGSCDMFMSRRLDDSWTRWTHPLNLGSTLNSKDWDASYTLDANGEYAYFVSYKNTNKGSADIFRAKLPKEARPEPVILIYGKVFNAKTNKPIGAEILYEFLPSGMEAGKALADPETGEYKIVLPLNSIYGFWARSRGFLSVNENIDMSRYSEYQEIRKDLYLAPIEVGQTIPLNNVFFEQSRWDLLSESYPELDRITLLMKENESIVVELAGHTDIEGSPVENMRLSAARVKSIKDYFIKKGIDEKRIKTVAFGGTKPLVFDRDEESKKKNRRVEFRILSY